MGIFFKNQFKLSKSAALPLPHRSGRYSNKMHSGWTKLPEIAKVQAFSLRYRAQATCISPAGTVSFSWGRTQWKYCIAEAAPASISTELECSCWRRMCKSHAQHRAHGCTLQFQLPTPTCYQRQRGAALVPSKGWVQEGIAGACPGIPPRAPPPRGQPRLMPLRCPTFHQNPKARLYQPQLER